MVGKISVTELETRIKNNNKPYLVDVREPFERDICKLEDDLNIPLQQLQQRFSEIDKTKEVVVYCRSGGRSMQACQFLSQNGFTNVSNLTGGVLAWSDYVDPTMPKY